MNLRQTIITKARKEDRGKVSERLDEEAQKARRTRANVKVYRTYTGTDCTPGGGFGCKFESLPLQRIGPCCSQKRICTLTAEEPKERDVDVLRADMRKREAWCCSDDDGPASDLPKLAVAYPRCQGRHVHVVFQLWNILAPHLQTSSSLLQKKSFCSAVASVHVGWNPLCFRREEKWSVLETTSGRRTARVKCRRGVLNKQTNVTTTPRLMTPT